MSTKNKARQRRLRGSDPDIKYKEVPCGVSGLVGPCYQFTGATHRGYGRVWNGRNMLVHVYVWQEAKGPVLSGMVLDHRCRNRACCNVNHLRVVTRKVNSTENVEGAQWQLNKAKTQCPRGHEYSESNTRVLSNGGRQCKACNRERMRRRSKVLR